MRGENLPGFLSRQLEFAAHVRDPAGTPAPADVDPRRMRVYVELIFNNVEALLASAFPVAKRVLGDAAWQQLVRAFLQRHGSASPYFPDVSQEFLEFLSGSEEPPRPGFLLELCHYEWVELGLGIADDAVLPDGVDPAGDLLAGRPVRSPLAWPLTYTYAVHRIAPGSQPEEPGDSPTHLVVYRDSHDRVRFMELNALAQRLLLLLDGSRTGQEALAIVGREAALGPARDLELIGGHTLDRLRRAGIILGALPPLETLE